MPAEVEVEAILVGLVLAVVLGALHLPFVLLDLRSQPTEVGRMWALPTVVLGAGFLLLFLLGWMLADHGLDAARAVSQGYLALGFAGWACATFAGMGIALARWLRPGGPLQTHWGTTLVGVAVVLALFVPAFALATHPSPGDLLLALPPLLVVLSVLGRSGPERFEEGRRTAVSAMVLAFGLVAVAIGFTTWFEGTGELFWYGAGALWLLLTAWAALVVRLRRWVFGVMALDLLCLGPVMLYQSQASAFPSEVWAPEPRDWWDEPTDQFDVDGLSCFELAGSGTRFGECGSESPVLVMGRMKSTADLLAEKEAKPYLAGLALGRGQAMLRWVEESPPAVPDLVITEGRLHYRGRLVSRELLRSHPPDQPLWVQAHPDIELYKLVLHCATATTGNRCGVMHGG